MYPTTRKQAFPTAASVALLLCISSATLANPPPGYYDSVDATNSTTLRTTLHAVIDDHTRFPYTSSGTDLRAVPLTEASRRGSKHLTRA